MLNDCFAQKENYLTAIDARVKLLFVAATLTLNLCATKWHLCLCTSLMCLLLLRRVKIPLRVVLMRLSAPLGITIAIALIQVFFYGPTPLFHLRIFSWTLAGYSEGLSRGVLIFSRVMAASSLVVFLSMTTPLNKILAALGFFKVPYTWIEITAFTYRYVFIILEDMATIRNAQMMRLGYSSINRCLRSMAEIAGAAVIKAYDHSVAIQEAMAARAGKGRIDEFYSSAKLTFNDWIASGIFGGIFLFLLMASIFIH